MNFFYQKQQTHEVKFGFSKQGLLRFISHLDTMRLLMRAARRAQLPLFFTKGFSPRPKLRFDRALKLGIESDCEHASIMVIRKISPRVFQKRLNAYLPYDIRIHGARYT